LKLTPKQQAFCEQYLVDLNATQAAIRAGYSPKTAQEQSSRLLSKAIVAEFIQQLMDARSKKTEVSSEVVLRELLSLATVDLSLAYDENGNLKQIHDIPPEVRKAIAGVETYYERVGKDEEGNPDLCTVKKLKFWDKTRALELLGRHLKLFTDRLESTGKDGGPIETKATLQISIEDRIAQLKGAK